jgi:hypothetical protein
MARDLQVNLICAQFDSRRFHKTTPRQNGGILGNICVSVVHVEARERKMQMHPA